MAKIVEKRQTYLHTLCSELIRAKGENPPGDVTAGAQVVERFLTENDISYQTFEPVNGHRSLIASVGKGKSSLLLCGHIDVVPAGDLDKWAVQPYAGELKQGRIYGRGSTDMKGGVAAMLMALAAAKDCENELSGSVATAIVPDEEVQGPAGVQWLLDNRKLEADTCIIAEPTSYLGSEYSVVAGERGTCWLRITAHGKSAHGSTPALGRNAIEMLTQFLPALKVLETEPVKTPEDAEAIIKSGEKELRNTARRRGVSVNNLARTLTHYTVNLGVISGGTKSNVVPDKCEAEIDVRVPIGGHPEGVERFVRCLLPQDVEYQLVNKTLPSYTPSNHAFVKSVQESALQVFGYRPSSICMAATTDAHYFREQLGIPAVTFGPGYLDLAHAYNEFVYLKDVRDMAEVYTNVIARTAA